MLTRRSRAREVVLQLLFQHDHNPKLERAAIEEFARERLRDAAPRRFCLELYDGVVKEQQALDQRLNAVAENWRVPRMPTVDRNVLRLGAYELLFTPQTPPAAVLDEAIELARRFGSKDSPAFVNGVLDRLKNAEGGTAEKGQDV
ncbi:MAG TPA: transcription antitermination factor NusB [Gemmataceae bacterium]|nr:transcription antitermination factor NusB [Gemmataceae bacterium]